MSKQWHFEKKQILKTKENTLINTAKYFDLIIIFCFSLYDSWMLNDQYTFKQVTFNFELKTYFFSRLWQSFMPVWRIHFGLLSSLLGSFPRWINVMVVQFPSNSLFRIFSLHLLEMKFFKFESILKKTPHLKNWNYARFILNNLCRFTIQVFIY